LDLHNQSLAIVSQLTSPPHIHLLFGVCLHFELGGVMARKAKRRAWTAADVRNLKGLAKEKTPATKIAKSLNEQLEQLGKKHFR
jgi:hypothetical protein